MKIIEMELRFALRKLYNTACHHPQCQRNETPHECSCGVSAALEHARKLLHLPNFEIYKED